MNSTLLMLALLPSPLTILSADLNGDSVQERIALWAQPSGAETLRLQLTEGGGQVISNDFLVIAEELEDNGESVYNVSLSQNEEGSLVISSVKDWGSANRAHDYTITYQAGVPRLSRYDFLYSYPSGQGECGLDLLEGKALVNGSLRKFALPETSLALASGRRLAEICHELLKK